MKKHILLLFTSSILLLASCSEPSGNTSLEDTSKTETIQTRVMVLESVQLDSIDHVALMGIWRTRYLESIRAKNYEDLQLACRTEYDTTTNRYIDSRLNRGARIVSSSPAQLPVTVKVPLKDSSGQPRNDITPVVQYGQCIGTQYILEGTRSALGK